jgi:hypothetical protein
MNRRNFLKAGTFLLSATALSRINGLGLSQLFTLGSNIKDFSIELIIEDCDKAVPLIESLIKGNLANFRIVKYSEFEIEGRQKGDIVFFNNGKLVNYKESDDVISKQIKTISTDLDLPRVIENPKKIRFYSQGTNADAERFLVIHKNTVIDEIEPTNAGFVRKVNGTIGNVSISVQNKKLRVTESSCLHKTCIKTNPISKAGDYIVCIPNELVIMAE